MPKWKFLHAGEKNATVQQFISHEEKKTLKKKLRCKYFHITSNAAKQVAKTPQSCYDTLIILSGFHDG